MADHDTKIQDRTEGSRTIYWYTCSCGVAGSIRYRRKDAEDDVKRHIEFQRKLGNV